MRIDPDRPHRPQLDQGAGLGLSGASGQGFEEALSAIRDGASGRALGFSEPGLLGIRASRGASTAAELLAAASQVAGRAAPLAPAVINPARPVEMPAALTARINAALAESSSEKANAQIAARSGRSAPSHGLAASMAEVPAHYDAGNKASPVHAAATRRQPPSRPSRGPAKVSLRTEDGALLVTAMATDMDELDAQELRRRLQDLAAEFNLRLGAFSLNGLIIDEAPRGPGSS